MFDLRYKIKIFVANGEVRCGSKVDSGFFPIFSVDTEEQAISLIEGVPWSSTDSLTTYARRLEDSLLKTAAVMTASQRRLAESRGVRLNVDNVSADIASALARGFGDPLTDLTPPNSIVQAIMDTNEEK